MARHWCENTVGIILCLTCCTCLFCLRKDTLRLGLMCKCKHPCLPLAFPLLSKGKRLLQGSFPCQVKRKNHYFSPKNVIRTYKSKLQWLEKSSFWKSAKTFIIKSLFFVKNSLKEFKNSKNLEKICTNTKSWNDNPGNYSVLRVLLVYKMTYDYGAM